MKDDIKSLSEWTTGMYIVGRGAYMNFKNSSDIIVDNFIETFEYFSMAEKFSIPGVEYQYALNDEVLVEGFQGVFFVISKESIEGFWYLTNEKLNVVAHYTRMKLIESGHAIAINTGIV